jgi:predicted DNA-binding transcriptional regulator YafY
MASQEKVAKTERLLNLISLLLKARRPVPFSDIAGQVIGYNDSARIDSIEKRFDRDKAELRNMGIPVDYVDTGDPDTAGYVIPKEKFFLGKLDFDSRDALLLAAAARSGTLAHASALMKEALASAMRKLSVDLPLPDDLGFEPAPVLQISSGSQKASANLQTICAAVYAKKTIAFDYAGAGQGAQEARRTVDPYGLGISRGEWYLVGYCHARAAVRMFKLARLPGQVSLTGASDSANEFEIPAGFKISDHLHREAWDFGDSSPITVAVRAPRELAAQLVQRGSIRWELAGDGQDARADSSVVSTQVRSVDRLIDWLFSLGPEVTVVGPREVRERARRRLAAMRAKYAGAAAGEAGR